MHQKIISDELAAALDEANALIKEGQRQAIIRLVNEVDAEMMQQYTRPPNQETPDQTIKIDGLPLIPSDVLQRIQRTKEEAFRQRMEEFFNRQVARNQEHNEAMNKLLMPRLMCPNKHNLQSD